MEDWSWEKVWRLVNTLPMVDWEMGMQNWIWGYKLGTGNGNLATAEKRFATGVGQN